MAEENTSNQNIENIEGLDALSRTQYKHRAFESDSTLNFFSGQTLTCKTQKIELSEKLGAGASQKLMTSSSDENLLLAVSQTNGNEENLLASFIRTNESIKMQLSESFLQREDVKKVLPKSENGLYEITNLQLSKDGNIKDVQIKGASQDFSIFFSALGFQAKSSEGACLVRSGENNSFNITVGKAFMEEANKENSNCKIENSTESQVLKSAIYIGLLNDAQRTNPNQTITINFPTDKPKVQLQSIPFQIERGGQVQMEHLNILRENGKSYLYVQTANINEKGQPGHRTVPNFKPIHSIALINGAQNDLYVCFDINEGGNKSVTFNVKLPTTNDENVKQSVSSLYNNFKTEFDTPLQSGGEKKSDFNLSDGTALPVYSMSQAQQTIATSFGNDVIATMRRTAVERPLEAQNIIEPAPEQESPSAEIVVPNQNEVQNTPPQTLDGFEYSLHAGEQPVELDNINNITNNNNISPYDTSVIQENWAYYTPRNDDPFAQSPSQEQTPQPTEQPVQEQPIQEPIQEPNLEHPVMQEEQPVQKRPAQQPQKAKKESKRFGLGGEWFTNKTLAALFALSVVISCLVPFMQIVAIVIGSVMIAKDLGLTKWLAGKAEKGLSAASNAVSKGLEYDKNAQLESLISQRKEKVDQYNKMQQQINDYNNGNMIGMTAKDFKKLQNQQTLLKSEIEELWTKEDIEAYKILKKEGGLSKKEKAIDQEIEAYKILKREGGLSKEEEKDIDQKIDAYKILKREGGLSIDNLKKTSKYSYNHINAYTNSEGFIRDPSTDTRQTESTSQTDDLNQNGSSTTQNQTTYQSQQSQSTQQATQGIQPTYQNQTTQPTASTTQTQNPTNSRVL